MLDAAASGADDMLRTPLGGAAALNALEAALDTVSDPLVGRDIGRYAIESVVARGGMGVVYRARQKSPHRFVALKVMKRNLTSRADRRRFQDESEILGRLQHPNIAQVFEAGVHDDGGGGVPFFAMEFVENAMPVTEFAAAHRLDTRARLELFLKVCNAVHHGHQKGVIHRDLKPGNILVDEHGEPKVIDFGVARSTDADLAVTTQRTAVGQLVGTMAYMSPEQCDGERDLDTRSDVYSLGVVLYELLAGAWPYGDRGSTMYEMIRVIKEDAPATLSSFDRKLRGDLEAIVSKAMEKPRERRYQSANELKKELERYLRGEPIEARKPGAWKKGVRWVGRHPVWTSAALALVITSASIIASYGTVWWLNRVPSHFVRSPDGKTLELVTRTGKPLADWHGIEPAFALFYGLVSSSLTEGRGTLAYVALREAVAEQNLGQFCVFDAGGDFEKPLWVGRVRNEDIADMKWLDPVLPATEAAFQVTAVKAADVFQQIPGVELLVSHMMENSLGCVRIYDLNGNNLWEVWHDGTAYPTWDRRSGVLVLNGQNTEAYWWERVGHEDIREAQHPVYVAAVRPELNQPKKRWLKTSVYWGEVEPLFYKALVPRMLELGNHGEVDYVVAPTINGNTDDAVCRVGVNFILGETDEDRGQAELFLNADGVIIVRRSSNQYRRMLAAEEVPPLEEYEFIEMPPPADYAAKRARWDAEHANTRTE